MKSADQSILRRAAPVLHALLYGERLRPWRWAIAFYLLAGVMTRVVLLLGGGQDAGMGPATVAAAFLVGAGRDVIAAAFLFLPLVAFLAVFPSSWRRRRLGRLWLLAGMAGWVFVILLIAVSEWVFWGEFGTRFNFIAVDYLVYTHEVLNSILESYPVVPMLAALAAASVVLIWWQRHCIVVAGSDLGRWRAELGAVALLAALPAGLSWLAPDPVPRLFENRYAGELAGNGVSGFFRAFRAAELDYLDFYPQLPRAEAYARVRRLEAAPDSRFVSADPRELLRRTEFADAPQSMNVVLITVESLSAKFMTRFGERRGLTPNLDRMAREGLLFTNHYATGTRTVRGLEALSLSVPPTPGESIVKRPHNRGLGTLGQVLGAHGYDVKFLYGGYALFDNMRAFFAGNGYTVIDRSDIPAQRIHHENAWGVADEDIYTQALLEMDQSYAAGHGAFLHVMTTSNHRPYTYPEGRIDLPSGRSGRPGAVKYTDWAIGDFIARARARPWFSDTLFVIVADHCASSAGRTELPLENYHVPLLIWSPGRIPAREEDQLAGQIDVAPTVLGLLRMDYSARFFGRDLLASPRQAPFVFVSTYQALGFFRDGELVELDPRAPPRVQRDGGRPHDATAPWDEATQDAIALYQVAADAFDRGALGAGGPG